MKQGYGVFGAAYEVMLRNDPHDPRSIDHELLLPVGPSGSRVL